MKVSDRKIDAFDRFLRVLRFYAWKLKLLIQFLTFLNTLKAFYLNVNLFFKINQVPEFRAGIRYQHLVSKMKPDQEVYDIQKLEQGENFFPDSNTSLTSKPVDRPEDVDKLVNLYNKQ